MAADLKLVVLPWVFAAAFQVLCTNKECAKK